MEENSLKSKKLIAYLVANAVLLVLAFTGKLASENIGPVLMAINLGYWGAQGAIDLGKVVQGAIAKRNGTG